MTKFNNSNRYDFESPYFGLDFSCKYFDDKDFIEKCANRKNLKFLSWNIQSLRSKFEQLKDYISFLKTNKIQVDIIALQEIFSITNSDMFKLEDYELVYLNRKTRGGGVGFYVKKGIKYKILKNISFFEDKLFESLSIQIEYNTKKFILSSIYRPNSPIQGMTVNEQLTSFIDKFSDLQTQINNYKCDSYIFTDSNIDILRFEQHEQTNEFLNLCLANGFISLITRPTRISRTIATCLDQIYTNSTNVKFESGILLNNISDHLPVFTITSHPYKKSKDSFIYSRNITDEKIENFNTLLRNIEWENVLNVDHPQTSFNNFMLNFNEAHNLTFPIQKIRIKKNIHRVEKFMTDGLLKCRTKKFALSALSIKNPTQENVSKYHLYRNIYTRAIKTAKKMYYSNELNNCKSDLRKTWGTLREAMRNTKDKSSSIDELRYNNEIFVNKPDISSKMNEHFTSVADKIASKINPSPKDPCDYMPNYNSRFKMHSINSNIIIGIVSKMEGKKSSDIFGISNFLLKKIINSIAFPLSHIINLSILTGIVPNDLKIAKVVPIYKIKGNNADQKQDPSNYRPISLLPIFSKILEKVIYQQLSCYLITNNIIYKHQYGFQAKKSTVHPVIHFLNYIADAKNESKIAIGVFCDLAKCFDTISHSILVRKLSKIGINGIELEWFKNYLKDRKQFVNVNNVDSNKLGINRGVPQGSILGPILFLIYINDLKNCTDLFTLLFADDSNFLISGKNFTELKQKLNIELKKITDWFRCNEMSLNHEKTKIMVFNKKENTIDFNSLNIRLNFNNEDQSDPLKIKNLSFINSNSEIPAIKFLGVYIDPELNFKYHIDHLRRKISTSLYFINRAKNLLTTNTLKMLYHSLINSHLLYCLPAWSCGLESTLNPLIKMQKRAIRIVTNKRYNSHTVPIFKDLEILPLKESAIYTKILFIYDYINGKLPESFLNTWLKRRDLNPRILRNSNMFDVKKPKFTSIERFPKFNFQDLWNKICNNENLTSNIRRTKFCKNLKESLLTGLNFVCNNPICNECP